MCPSTDVTRKLYIPTKHRSYWCLEFNPPTHHPYAKDPREASFSYHTKKVPSKKDMALEKKLTSVASGDKWHIRLGHSGPETLKHLPSTVKGNIIVSSVPTTKECEVCMVSKAQQIISRSDFQEHPSTRPFQRVSFDLIPMTSGYNGHNYLSHFSCDFCDFIFNFNHKRKRECVQCFIYVVNIIKTQWKQDVQFSHTDGETSFGKEGTENNAFWDFIHSKGIMVETSSPRTQSQNGASEVVGRWIIVKTRTLRIHSGQPRDLWPERALAAAVIQNRMPIIWKSPYEVAWQSPPVIFQLIAYGSKAYPLDKIISSLDREGPRSFVGYLVGYEGTGIFRVWIPSQKAVTRTRDVVFDKDDIVYDPSEIDAAILYTQHIETRLVTKPLPQVQYEVDVSSIQLSDNTEDTEGQTLSPIMQSMELSDEDISTPDSEDTSSKGGEGRGSLFTPPTGYTPVAQQPANQDASKGASKATSVISSRLSSVPASTTSSLSARAKAKVKPGYSYTKEPPKKEITSENVPVFEDGCTRGDRKRKGPGPAGSSFYTIFQHTSEWNSAFSAFINSVK